MSACKRHLADAALRKKVVARYRKSSATLAVIAGEFGIGCSTAQAIIVRDIPSEERAKLKAIKYSLSKMGDRNPARGRRPSNWKGDCSDGRGYWTRLVRGKRYFVHRIVMAELIGIPVEALPEELEVHHIDEDPSNNDPSNLALTNSLGHKNVHRRMRQDRATYVLHGLSLADAIALLTSR